jgi:hypothetical protein
VTGAERGPKSLRSTATQRGKASSSEIEPQSSDFSCEIATWTLEVESLTAVTAALEPAMSSCVRTLVMYWYRYKKLA